MSMTLSIKGFIAPDETWKKMKTIWDACIAADIQPPEMVCKFFDDEEPDSEGKEVELPIVEWSNEASEGYELYISKIPKSVKIIRFYASW